MDATHTLSLDLPTTLYDRIQDAALRRAQPVESVLVESLSLLFGDPAVDSEQATTALENLSDTQQTGQQATLFNPRSQR